MDYVELEITCNPDYKEILIAEAGNLGFDSMMETDSGFKAYMSTGNYDDTLISALQQQYGKSADLKWDVRYIEKKNWNEEWEKNYDPVIIENRCVIRASFHDEIPNVKYQIIIDPKMSFGTGHHETTTLMVRIILEMELMDKAVLDCGCGTGILSLLAHMMNARSVIGFDIDDWAVQNSIENAHKNGIEDITFLKGTISSLNLASNFDLVLANINKNILLNELAHYQCHLSKGGSLVLSGFYKNDLEQINRKASQNGLKFVRSLSLYDWEAAQFQKI